MTSFPVFMFKLATAEVMAPLTTSKYPPTRKPVRSELETPMLPAGPT